EMRRRAAIEPVIGHLKEDHRMRRNYLTGRDGDRINAVLAAAGYNFSLLLRWFEELLPALSLILWHALLAASLHLTRCRKTFFTADYLGSGAAGNAAAAAEKGAGVDNPGTLPRWRSERAHSASRGAKAHANAMDVFRVVE